MRKHIRPFQLVGRNRYELYFSFVIVFVGFCNSAVLPHGYQDRLIAAGSLLLGLVCSFNAVLDFRRMNFVEFVVGMCWFVFLLATTPLILWNTAHIEAFSPR